MTKNKEIKIYKLSRNGKVIAPRLVLAEKNGKLWNGTKPVLDSQADGFDKVLAETLIAKKQFDKIPTEWFVGVGVQGSLEVAEVVEQKPAPLSLAESKRRDINKMFWDAEKRVDYPGEYYRALAIAEKALAEWRAEFPAEAKAEENAKKLSRASDLRSQASQATAYDADGWINRDEQVARRDELIAQAEAIEAEVDA